MGGQRVDVFLRDEGRLLGTGTADVRTGSGGPTTCELTVGNGAAELLCERFRRAGAGRQVVLRLRFPDGRIRTLNAVGFDRETFHGRLI